MRVLPLAMAISIALIAAASACGSRTPLLPGDAAVVDAHHDAREEARVDAAEEPLPDVVDSGCESDAACDDGRSCDVGTCTESGECTYMPRDCDDGVACTTDSCDETKRACTHTPDDGLCPDDQLCSVLRGCAPFVYAVAADGHLYEVDVPTGQAHDVGLCPAFPSDVALASDSTLFVTDSYVLYVIDRSNATTTAVGSIMPLYEYNALGSQPNSRGGAEAPLLAMTTEATTGFQVNPTTAQATPYRGIPAGWQSSGDVTNLGVTAQYASLTSSTAQTTDSLYRLDTAVMVGDTGFSCVWGLATLGGQLYGFTCKGLVVALDATTGKGTMLAQSLPAFVGAAGR